MTEAGGNPIVSRNGSAYILGESARCNLQALAPRKYTGVPEKSAGPDVNLGLNPEEALKGVLQGHDLELMLIEVPGAGFTVVIIADTRATAILHVSSKMSCQQPGKS